MTEEITAALAKVPSLQVVARASAFQFKGERRDMRAVGQALNARYLIDGSVRKAGNRVRITAQLVRADTGVNVWTDNYDRELTDIFAIQEDIAKAIAGALQAPLGLAQGETLVRDRTNDLASYDQFLRARALLRARGESNKEAIAILENVVAKDAGFAPAWGLLAYAYALAPGNTGALFAGSLEDARRSFQDYLQKAEIGARKAIQLDPRHVDGYVALAYTRAQRGMWAEAEDLFKQALALEPNDAEALHEYSVILCYIGRIRECASIRDKLLTLETFVPIFSVNSGIYFYFAGRVDDAVRVLQRVTADGAGGIANVPLAHIYASQGRYGEAADTLLRVTSTVYSRAQIEDAARLLRRAPENAPSQSLPALGAGLGFVYVYVGAPEPNDGTRNASCKSGIRLEAPSGIQIMRLCGKRNASKPSCAPRASSIIGKRVVGRICAARSAPTISSAINSGTPLFSSRFMT